MSTTSDCRCLDEVLDSLPGVESFNASYRSGWAHHIDPGAPTILIKVKNSEPRVKTGSIGVSAPTTDL